MSFIRLHLSHSYKSNTVLKYINMLNSSKGSSDLICYYLMLVYWHRTFRYQKSARSILASKLSVAHLFTCGWLPQIFQNKYSFLECSIAGRVKIVTIMKNCITIFSILYVETFVPMPKKNTHTKKRQRHIPLKGWDWIRTGLCPPFVLNNSAPISWACSIMSVYDEATPYTWTLPFEVKVKRSNRGCTIQWEQVGKYRPYPVKPFVQAFWGFCILLYSTGMW